MIDFHPNKLIQTLKAVRKAHTYRKGEAIKVGKSLVDSVRKILKQSSPDELETIIYGLTLKELMACVEIVDKDRNKNIVDKASTAIELRPAKAMIPKIWFKLIRGYPHHRLEKLLKMLIEKKGGLAIIEHQDISKDAIQWLMADDLTTGIIMHYKIIRQPLDFDQFLDQHQIETKESLFKIAWQTLLTKGTKSMITRQNPKRIIEEIDREIKADQSISMGQHYLNTIKDRQIWDQPILEYIHSKWDKPVKSEQSTTAEHRFWKNVSEKARDEFHKWLMIQKINDYLEGERADFWRVYVENGELEDISIQEKGFLMQFYRFGVVEFIETGNAAYVYPIKHLMHFMNLPSMKNSTLADFKNKKQTIKDKDWDGRIIHRPGWQESTRNRMQELMNR